MNLNELGQYKSKIISKLINSSKIVDIVLSNPDDSYEIDDQLLGNESLKLEGHIFPFEYIPNTNETAKTFICTEITCVELISCIQSYR